MTKMEFYRSILREIEKILGPHADGCKVNKCPGCKYEMVEALKAARRGLRLAKEFSNR